MTAHSRCRAPSRSARRPSSPTAELPVPDACQIVRGTTVNGGEPGQQSERPCSHSAAGQSSNSLRITQASQGDGVDVRPRAPNDPARAFPAGGSRATVRRAPRTACRDRRGKQRGQVWCADQDRRAMSAEGGDRHLPVSSPPGTVVCVRCGATQGEGSQGEEAQDPQEALTPADIHN